MDEFMDRARASGLTVKQVAAAVRKRFDADITDAAVKTRLWNRSRR